jgi:hypothetical protein
VNGVDESPWNEVDQSISTGEEEEEASGYDEKESFEGMTSVVVVDESSEVGVLLEVAAKVELPTDSLGVGVGATGVDNGVATAGGGVGVVRDRGVKVRRGGGELVLLAHRILLIRAVDCTSCLTDLPNMVDTPDPSRQGWRDENI